LEEIAGLFGDEVASIKEIELRDEGEDKDENKVVELHETVVQARPASK
jgi:hypothetical protein